MTVLQRYIAASLLRGWLLVLLVLAAVFGLLGFIQELDRAGGDYGPLAAARYTLFCLPSQLVSLAPVIALLGSIIAFAGLGRSNELTIMCGAGMPLRGLLFAAALPTAALMLLLWAGMEYLTAPLHRDAEEQREVLRHRDGLPEGSAWSRRGDRYIRIGTLRGGVPGNIEVYEFDEDSRLQRALRAVTAEAAAERSWLLRNVRSKQRVDGVLTTGRVPELEVSGLWSAAELPGLALSSDSLPLSVLYDYSYNYSYNYSHNNSYGNSHNDGDNPSTDIQPADRHRGMFWQKFAMPFTVAAMVLLATAIGAAPGAQRDRHAGVNLAIGALVGILFYLGTQILFALYRLLSVSEAAVAFAPAVIVALAAAAGLHRLRW